MQASWLRYRQWKFKLDMNGDGALTTSDVTAWAHWLFFMPGDALIALIGPTSLGRYLELTPASVGSATSGWISVALWPLILWAAYYLYGVLLDCSDPTYRQQRREWLEAQARSRRAGMERARQAVRRRRFFWRFG